MSVAVILGLANFIGFNSSPSAAPVGFYWRSTPHPARGALVEVCLPTQWATLAIERGYIHQGWQLAARCPGGAQALGKTIIGMPGDVVDIEPDMVLGKDTRGRPIAHVPFGKHRVAPGTVWLYGAARNSFDSRYYGSLPEGNIIANLSPIWTWRIP